VLPLASSWGSLVACTIAPSRRRAAASGWPCRQCAALRFALVGGTRPASRTGRWISVRAFFPAIADPCLGRFVHRKCTRDRPATTGGARPGTMPEVTCRIARPTSRKVRVLSPLRPTLSQPGGYPPFCRNLYCRSSCLFGMGLPSGRQGSVAS